MFSLYVETIIDVLQVCKLLYDIEGDGVFPTPHGTMTYIPVSYNLKVVESSRTPGNIQIHCNKSRRFPPFLMHCIVQKNIFHQIHVHVGTAINSRITFFKDTYTPLFKYDAF